MATTQAQLVLAAGISRSGSTWLYNAARLVLKSRHGAIAAAWVEDAVDPGQISLIKIHEPNEEMANKANVILTCHRDLRDVVVSAKRMGWAPTPESQIAWARQTREHHEFWSPRSSLDVDYRDIIRSPERLIANLALVLAAPDADPARISASLDAIPPHVSNRPYDAITLLHVNHRHNGAIGIWRRQLDPHTAAIITDANRAWLLRHGYED